ncbi:MAG: 50S ribosomal protein L5 [Candidatus Daviesbacteria bacterium]|nr:50S ribosomal protein L5 [Candidatus Daviesbacteria bacterium]
MNRFQNKYVTEVQPKLATEYNIKNKFALPKVEKVVISIGLGEAKDNQGILDKVKQYCSAISGQKPVVTLAKKSISSFKVTQGQPVGMMVTLRGEKMYSFLDKLINIVLPKVRDFKGISEKAFDGMGNLNLGIREQTIFPEVDYKTIDKTRGMAVTIVTSTKSKEQGKKLLELLGMPFRN